jgi:hypothetical protein
MKPGETLHYYTFQLFGGTPDDLFDTRSYLFVKMAEATENTHDGWIQVLLRHNR